MRRVVFLLFNCFEGFCLNLVFSCLRLSSSVSSCVSSSAFSNLYTHLLIFICVLFYSKLSLRVCHQLTEAFMALQALAVKEANEGDLRDCVYLGFTRDSKQPLVLTFNFLWEGGRMGGGLGGA